MIDMINFGQCLLYVLLLAVFFEDVISSCRVPLDVPTQVSASDKR